MEGQLFSDRVSRSVEKGDLEVMSFCLMPNHAHLIARGPSDGLGDAMRDVEGVYVRSFNRPRGRLGHLMQARYRAKPIRTQRYMTAAIAYVDQNPVVAGLVEQPASYPLGSARYYARQSGPSWLDRSWVEAYLRSGTQGFGYRPEEYARVFCTRTAASAHRWFVAAMESPRPDDPTLDALLAASPDHILRWMEERARSADGTHRIIPLVDDAVLTHVIAALPASHRSRGIGAHRRASSAEQALRVGLLRRLVGASFAMVSVHVGCTVGVAKRAARDHEWALVHDSAYRELVASVTRVALDACHPGARPKGV